MLVLQSLTSRLLYIHTNELLLHMFFLEHYEKLHTFVCFFFNSLFTCILDQVPLSCTVPYNVTPESNIKVTRKKGNDHQPKIVKQFLLGSTLYSVENSMENIHTDDRL